jgi:hypothetical protein
LKGVGTASHGGAGPFHCSRYADPRFMGLIFLQMLAAKVPPPGWSGRCQVVCGKTLLKISRATPMKSRLSADFVRCDPLPALFGRRGVEPPRRVHQSRRKLPLFRAAGELFPGSPPVPGNASMGRAVVAAPTIWRVGLGWRSRRRLHRETVSARASPTAQAHRDTGPIPASPPNTAGR